MPGFRTAAVAASTALAATAALAFASGAPAARAAAPRCPLSPPSAPAPAPPPGGQEAAQPPAKASAPLPVPPLVRYPAAPSRAVGKKIATLGGLVDPQGAATAYAFEYGRTTAYGSCTSALTLPARVGGRTVRAKLSGLAPGTTYHFRLVAANAGGTAAGVDETFTTVRAERLVAQGVTVNGVRLGGLTQQAAERALRAAFARPLRFSFHGRTWSATPAQLGARAYVGGAVRRALAQASRARRLSLVVTVDGARVRHYVAYLERTFSRPARVGSVRLDGSHAVVVPAREGIAVEKVAMTAAIVQALKAGGRGPLPLLARTTHSPTASSRAVVIRLGAQKLTAYEDGKQVLAALVTTGRPALPTPVGSFTAAWRASPYTFISPWPKGNPFWYPPTPVTWAIYFHDNDFMHDDPGEPASAFGPGSQNGPYASHGCVHVPHDAMAFLYRWLPNGATVIVAQS